AYGGEIADVLETVTYTDGEGSIKTAGKDELEMGYRKSMFTDKDYIILSCVMKLRHEDNEKIREKMREFSKRRMEKQPLSQPSAGSTFKRPEGNFAGKLIEDAGLKGFSIGGAQVSTKHGGFVVNTGCATAKDVMDVIDHVCRKVDSRFGVKLEPEVRIVGERDTR
ncbi:MAG: UDP-N-acetylmuramate dehydrogenase, partial [Oscillospiraceae bacterium]|nr:UDP-N-acetylmuramate dehydrogenase [Oscillospiraceae bacterium]